MRKRPQPPTLVQVGLELSYQKPITTGPILQIPAGECTILPPTANVVVKMLADIKALTANVIRTTTEFFFYGPVNPLRSCHFT